MLHYTGARDCQRATATALVLEADGRRVNGRWAYGVLNNLNSEDPQNSAWLRAIHHAGVVLDYAPNLAGRILDGSLALDNV